MGTRQFILWCCNIQRSMNGARRWRTFITLTWLVTSTFHSALQRFSTDQPHFEPWNQHPPHCIVRGVRTFQRFNGVRRPRLTAIVSIRSTPGCASPVSDGENGGKRFTSCTEEFWAVWQCQRGDGRTEGSKLIRPLFSTHPPALSLSLCPRKLFRNRVLLGCVNVYSGSRKGFFPSRNSENEAGRLPRSYCCAAMHCCCESCEWTFGEM